jgi:hypothetical protein
MTKDQAIRDFAELLCIPEIRVSEWRDTYLYVRQVSIPSGAMLVLSDTRGHFALYHDSFQATAKENYNRVYFSKDE